MVLDERFESAWDGARVYGWDGACPRFTEAV